jgi:hypothetical protein
VKVKCNGCEERWFSKGINIGDERREREERRERRED